MAITQSVGSLRVMPEAPPAQDPLLQAKAFSIGQQIGNELAGLTLAGEKLRFEKAKLKAQEEGLKFEQSVARLKLKQAETEISREAELAPLRLAGAREEVRGRQLQNEAAALALEEARTPYTPGAPLANVSVGSRAVSGAPSDAQTTTPQTAVSLADATVTPAAAAATPQEAAAPAAQGARYNPTISDPAKNPLFVVEEISNTVRDVGGVDNFYLRAVETEAVKRIANTYGRMSVAQARKVEPEIRTKIADELKPRNDFVRLTDDRGIKMRAPATFVGQQAVELKGPAEIDPEGIPESQKTLDKEFVKVLQETSLQAAQAEANIAQLQTAMDALATSDMMTGPLISLIPEAARKRLPFGISKGFAAQQTVEQVTAQSLRQILGGQFAMREGENLLKRAFDPAQQEAENIRRIRVTQATLQAAAQARRAERAYFDANGTLWGYDGPRAEDIFRQLAQEFAPIGGVKSAPSNAAPAGQPVLGPDPVQDLVSQGLERYLGGG